MDSQTESATDKLFYKDLIRHYVTPRFIERPWLADRVEAALADPDCRFMLLTAEPGAGKTAFTAWLASQHQDWPRYFIRRDSQTPLSSGDARSFLFAVGHQLATLRPTLFRLDKLEVVVKQRVSELQASGKTVGIEIEELTVSPFRDTALKVEQNVRIVAGDLVGIHIERVRTEERFLELGNLQYMALLDPAQVLAKEDPDARIVILTDALDELRYHAGPEDILDWLAICPELPSNVRFVLTSRPEPELDIFRQRQHRWLKEDKIDPHSKQVQADLRRYAVNFVTEESIAKALTDQKVDSGKFMDQAVTRAEGNFQYLVVLCRGIQRAIETGKEQQLEDLLKLESVPVGLNELYAFFLTQIKNSVAAEHVEIADDAPFEWRLVRAWEGLYQPILGALSVAQEPLTAEQIKNLAGIRTTQRWLPGALERLEQFLDHEVGGYRLYHSTFPEFLTSADTRTTCPDFYLDPTEWHSKIAAHYRGQASSWEEVKWSQVNDYGLFHLLAHLYALRNNDVYRQHLYELICRPYMQEKIARTLSHRTFAEDVGLVVRVAGAEQPPDWAQMIRGSFIYATLGDLVTKVPWNVLGALAWVGQVARAQDYAKLVQDADTWNRAYLAIAEALLAREEFEEAKEILEQVLEAVESLQSPLIEIAGGLAQAGDEQRALEAITQMITMALAAAEEEAAMFYEEEDTYKAAALGQVACGLVEMGNNPSAAEVAKRALVASLMPEVEKLSSEWHKATALSQVAVALARLGLRREAIKIADRALALAALEKIDAIQDKMHKSAALREACQTSISVLEALVHAKERARAAEVIDLILASPVVNEAQAIQDGVALNNVYQMLGSAAETLVWLGDNPRAQEVIDRILAAPRGVDEWDNALMLSGVAQALARTGDKRAIKVANQAFEILDSSIEDWEERTDVLIPMIKVLVQVGEFERASAVVQATHDWDKPSAQQALVNALIQAKEFEQALMAAKMPGVARGDTIHALIRVARVLVGSGDAQRAVEVVDEALKMAEDIEDEWNKPIPLSYAAQLLTQVGESERAEKLADQALALALAVAVFGGDDWSKATALYSIAQALAQVGEKEKAVEVANQALAAIESPWSDNSEIAVKAAGALVSIGETKKALAIAEEMDEEFNRQYVLSRVVWSLAQTGDKDQVEQILSLAEAKGIEWDGYLVSNIVAATLSKVGEFERALTIAEGIRREQGQAVALSEIAQAVAQAGNKQWAFEITEYAEPKAYYGDEMNEATGLSKVAQAYAQAWDGSDDLEIAREVAIEIAYEAWKKSEAIEDANDRVSALCDVAQAFIQIDEQEKASEILDQASAEGAFAQGKLIQTLDRLGQRERALRILCDHLIAARWFGRGDVLYVLEEGATVLAGIDQGQTLWQVYEAMMAVESWWATQASSRIDRW